MIVKPQSRRSDTSTRRSDRRLRKRFVDLAIAIPMLIITAPVLIVAIALICWNEPGNPIFRQARVGKGGRPFTMFKLRTMYLNNDDAEARKFNRSELLGEVDAKPTNSLFKLENDCRIMPVGRFLRRLSIDELPQLWNVLRGDMSIVGPRPSLAWEVSLFTREQLRRHEVPPGMTGLWQVSGRNRLSMQQMLALDLTYVDQQSILLDMQILWRTLPAVISGNTS
jgi:lipopolysaccharide/colanic/teichoic acid biosynthesis glycosyltransferase